VKEDMPIDPGWVRKKLKTILEHAQCKSVRFHDLRHTFATTALEHGMDVKTLSAVIGHVSAATTLDIYTHITSDMQSAAAASIDRGIMKNEPTQTTEQEKSKAGANPFTPYTGGRRKAGTGCLTQINDHLWEGRYSPKWPDGKKHSRNVYAHAREECEVLLRDLIVQMKAEIAERKVGANDGSQYTKKKDADTSRRKATAGKELGT
jgi:type II secretory pathway component HofQ